MTGNTPSNPLASQNTRLVVEVAELGRKLGEAKAYGDLRTNQLNDAIRDNQLLVGKVERLTAERDRAVANLDAGASGKRRITEERDRLRAALAEYHRLAKEAWDRHELSANIFPARLARETTALLAGAAEHRPKDRPIETSEAVHNADTVGLGRPPDETTTPREEPYKCNMHPGCPNPTPVPHWHE